ncbi:MAG TPA: GGDEF domain-containing protein [Fimbriimonas sp.]|nr:GGDEF domain-containing protein [Fimbriimonas sp.]
MQRKPWYQIFGVEGPESSKAAGDALGLARFAAHLYRHFILRPSEQQSHSFSSKLTQIEEKAVDGLSPHQYQTLSRELEAHVIEFAEFQRSQVDDVVLGFSDALDELLQHISGSVETQAGRLEQIEAIRACIADANQAESFEQTKGLLAKGLQNIQDLIEREIERHRDLRSNNEDYAARLRSRLEVVEKESRTDPLTRISNRAGITKHVKSVLDHVRISGNVYSFALIEMDGLQVLNDAYGHRVGDAALIGFASRLQSAVGEKCFVGRLSGDEFVAVGPMTADLLTRVLHRLNEHLREHPIAHQGKPLPILATFASLGISRSETLEELLQNADTHLKVKKQQRWSA